MSDLLFEGIENIKVGSQRIPRLTEGEFVLDVQDVIWFSTREKGDAFIVEFSVRETSDPTNHPVGCKRSWYQPMIYNKDAATLEIVKFMYAALGYEPGRDKDRIAAEVTPNIRATTNAACKQKTMNGKATVRVNVSKKPPSEMAKLKAAAKGKTLKEEGYDNMLFSPLSPNPPPLRT